MAKQNQNHSKYDLRIAGVLFPELEPTVVNMGDDGEDQFWSILGVSKDDTVVTPDFLNRPILEPRLFHITEKRPYEINNFSKSVRMVKMNYIFISFHSGSCER